MENRVQRALFSSFALLGVLSANAAAGPSATETQLDRQAYLEQKPHITTALSEARVVAALAARIAPVAQKIYQAPFSFYLTTESDPDAYSFYGPRVYVSRGMVDFADNMEELAGVMCHEASHVLHHDGTRTDRTTAVQDARVKAFLSRAMRLTHKHMARAIGSVTGAEEKLAQLRYTRGQEEAADLSGATVCSNAGSNPWGIVWMLRKLQREAPSRGLSWLADHPSNKARIAALSKYLRRNAIFETWNSDETLVATPIKR